MNRYTDEERRRILSWRETESLTYPELSRRTWMPRSALSLGKQISQRTQPNAARLFPN